MSDQMSQLEKLSQVIAGLTQQSLDLSPIMDAVAQRIAGEAQAGTAEALVSIKDAGFDPYDFIPVSRSAMRNAQLRQRMAQEQQVHEANLEHLKQMQGIEQDLKRGSVNRINNGPVTVPSLAD